MLVGLLRNALKFTPPEGCDQRPRRDAVGSMVSHYRRGHRHRHLRRRLGAARTPVRADQFTARERQQRLRAGPCHPARSLVSRLHGGTLTIASTVGSGTSVCMCRIAEYCYGPPGDGRDRRSGARRVKSSPEGDASVSRDRQGLSFAEAETRSTAARNRFANIFAICVSWPGLSRPSTQRRWSQIFHLDGAAQTLGVRPSPKHFREWR